jgi:hypothetical protein
MSIRTLVQGALRLRELVVGSTWLILSTFNIWEDGQRLSERVLQFSLVLQSPEGPVSWLFMAKMAWDLLLTIHASTTARESLRGLIHYFSKAR